MGDASRSLKRLSISKQKSGRNRLVRRRKEEKKGRKLSLSYVHSFHFSLSLSGHQLNLSPFSFSLLLTFLLLLSCLTKAVFSSVFRLTSRDTRRPESHGADFLGPTVLRGGTTTVNSGPRNGPVSHFAGRGRVELFTDSYSQWTPRPQDTRDGMSATPSLSLACNFSR